MNISQLKSYIKDLPDEMEVWRYDGDYQCNMFVDKVTIEEAWIYTIWLEGKYINLR